MFALSPVLAVLNGNGMEQNELAPVGLSIFATQNYNLVLKKILQDSCFLGAKLDLLDSIQIWLPGSKNVLIFLAASKIDKVLRVGGCGGL